MNPALNHSVQASLEPQIWSSVIRNLQLPLSETGLDVQSLLQAASIEPRTLEHPHGQVPLSRYLNFMNLAAERAQDPLLGLKTAKVVGPEILGAVGFLFLTARTLLDALRYLCHYQPLFQDSTAIRLVRRNDEYIYSYSLYDIHNLDSRQDIEFSIAFSLRLIRMYSNNQAQIKRLTFKHAASMASRNYEHALGCPCFFHQDENTLVLASEGLQDRGHRYDANLEQILIDYLESDIQAKSTLQTTADRIKQCIRDEVGPSLVTAEQVADRLGVSTASLYRRLRAENTTFKRLAESVYLDLATRYLRETQLSIAQISDVLGFSSPSSFTRAFNHWSHGQTPKQVRAQLTR